MKKYRLAFTIAFMLVAIMAQVIMAAPPDGLTHKVVWGDTLYNIADRYGVTVEAVMRANGLVNPNAIYLGQTLIIKSATNIWNAPSNCANEYLVKYGETLSDIANRNNTNVAALLRLNHLANQDMVYAGQKLCITAAVSDEFAPPQRIADGNIYYHTVVAGETLNTIALEYNANQQDIVQMNRLADPTYIQTGQKLAIPGYHPSDVPFLPKTILTPVVVAVVPQSPKPAYQPKQAMPMPVATEIVQVPPAPGYQLKPVATPLPVADHPIMVEVDSREMWSGEVYASRSVSKMTTLIVQTGDEWNKTVHLRSGDYELTGNSVLDPQFGSFRFVVRNIQPGDYDIWIDDPSLPSAKAQVRIENEMQVEVTFSRATRFQAQTFASPSGWILTRWDNPSKVGKNMGSWSNILVHAPSSGLPIVLKSEGTYQARCLTGSKGPGACDFAGLSAGTYTLQIEGTDLTIKTYLDGAAYAVFDFSRQAVPSRDEGKVGPYFMQ